MDSSLRQIAEKHGTTRDVVRALYAGATWKEISKDYDFSGHKDARYKVGSSRPPSKKGVMTMGCGGKDKSGRKDKGGKGGKGK